MVNRLARFRRDDRGVTLIEGLIAFPLLLTMIITFVEFGYAVFQWQQTGRAVAIGARLAAVSDPLAPAASYDALASDYLTSTTVGTGDPVPAALVRVTCAGATPPSGASTCLATPFNRILFGSDNTCNPSFGTSVPGMCDLNARITAANVLVTYTRDGLGYVGREGGPVVTVTVQLRNMTFQTFFLGRLFGLNSIPMRPSPITFTGEDLASCANPVRNAGSFSTPCLTPTPTP